MANKIKERLREVISNSTEDTIIIIWISEDTANSCKAEVNAKYLNFVRECSAKRKLETYSISPSLPSNFEVLTTTPSRAISVGATVEALKNSASYFDEVINLCDKYNFSYIQIL